MAEDEYAKRLWLSILRNVRIGCSFSCRAVCGVVLVDKLAVFNRSA
jgi:hypothetical protein